MDKVEKFKELLIEYAEEKFMCFGHKYLDKEKELIKIYEEAINEKNT